MSKAPWFKDWFNSPYYHLLYQHRDDREAFEFIKTLLNYLNPPKGSTMLDVACGKGRHSKAMAEMGFDVTGTDLSEASILEARQGESDNLHFFQHDMRHPFQQEAFSYAFNFFTSFGYFDTTAEHDDAIKSIADSLQKGGLFVLDYLNVTYAAQHPEHSFVKTIDGISFHVTKWQDDFHFFKQIQITDQDHPSPLDLYTEKVAKFTFKHFEEMFLHHGLQIETVFGDYHLAEYDEATSPRLILLARKPL